MFSFATNPISDRIVSIVGFERSSREKGRKAHESVRLMILLREGKDVCSVKGMRSNAKIASFRSDETNFRLSLK